MQEITDKEINQRIRSCKSTWYLLYYMYIETNYMYVTDPKCVLQVQLYIFAGSSLNWGIYTSCILICIFVNIVCTFTNKEFGGLILK